MGGYYLDLVRNEAQAPGFTQEQVRGWTSPAKVKGRRGKRAGS
jgi:hypothetical protein